MKWQRSKFDNSNRQSSESIKYSLSVFIGLIFFRLVLDYIYVHIISPIYAYSGFICERNISGFILSWGIYIVFFPLVKNIVLSNEEHISTIITTTIYLISFTPFTSLIYMGVIPDRLIITMCLYWCILLILLGFTNRSTKKRSPVLYAGVYPLDDKLVVIIGIIASLVVVFVSWIYTDFHLQLDLEVYGQRSKAAAFAMPQILRYMFSWSRAIIPLIFAYSVIHEKIIPAIWYLAVSFLSFGVDGSKTVLFMPILVLVVIILAKKINFCQIKVILIYGITAVAIISAMIYTLRKSITLVSLFVRRVLYVPAIINVYYFDFFSSHEPDFFRSGFLSKLGATSPYTKYVDIPHTIGMVYYQNPNTGANNGLFSDAIANLGFMGTIIMPFFTAFVIWLFDRCTYGLDKRVILASAMYISFALVSSSLTTTLMTHGLIVMMIITSVMKRDDYMEVDMVGKEKWIKARLT